MKTITLTAIALLLCGGSAFAGSDHFGSDWQYPPATDNAHTSSMTNTQDKANTNPPRTVYKPIAPKDEYGRGHWGR